MSTKKFVAYRTHFLFSLATSFIYGILNLSFFWLVFQAGELKEIVGFSIYEVYFVFAITQVIYAITWMFFYETANAFRFHIHNGWLDVFLLKPINVIFYTTFERIYYFNGLSVFLYSGFIFFLTIPHIDVNWNIYNILQLFYIILIGLLVFASLIWVSSLVWFFWPNFRSLRMLINNSFDFNKNPTAVYPEKLRWILTFIMPVLVVGNQTYYWMRGEYGLTMMLRDAGILLIFLLIYAIFWREGLKRYNSAN